MARLVLETDLPPGECFRLLEAHTDPWSLRSWGATDAFFGKLTPPRFKLMSPAFGRNPFRSVFHGRVVQDQGRTRLYARLGLPVSSFLVLTFALAFPAALTLPPAPTGPDDVLIRIPLYWLAFGALFRWVGAWDHGGPADRFTAFLVDLLGGSAAPKPTGRELPSGGEGAWRRGSGLTAPWSCQSAAERYLRVRSRAALCSSWRGRYAARSHQLPPGPSQ